MSEPKTAQQFNASRTGQLDLRELRKEIETIKEAAVPNARMFLDELLTSGDCYILLPSGDVLRSDAIVWDSETGYYEQRGEGLPSVHIPANKILHLRRVVP